MSLRLYPPSELQISEEALWLLTKNVVACRFGRPGETPWLFDGNGAAYPILVVERFLEFKFEVFSLEIPSQLELHDRHAHWTAPLLPDDLPEELRVLMSTHPPPPVAPLPSTSWPFQCWGVDLLKRVEFITEDDIATNAVGYAPNAQGAARPGEVPRDAAAACEVAAGFLFSDVEGERLLIGVDWMPYHMVISRDPAQIDEYLECCIAVSIKAG